MRRRRIPVKAVVFELEQMKQIILAVIEKCAIEFGTQLSKICEVADSVFADEHGCP